MGQMQGNSFRCRVRQKLPRNRGTEVLTGPRNLAARQTSRIQEVFPAPLAEIARYFSDRDQKSGQEQDVASQLAGYPLLQQLDGDLLSVGLMSPTTARNEGSRKPVAAWLRSALIGMR